MFSNHKSDTDQTFDYSNIETQLKIINSNILYLTHEMDNCVKIVQLINNTVQLKKQADDYHDDRRTEAEGELQ